MNETDYSKLTTTLCQDANEAAWYIAFIEALVDNEEYGEKVNGSFSGYAAAVARAGVKTSLILYVARAWDRSHNAISLHRAFENLRGIEELDARRTRRHEDLGIGTPVSLRPQYDTFNADYERVKDNEYHPTLKLMRTEHYAHRVLQEDCNQRTRLSQNGAQIEAVTYGELLKLSHDTLTLVGQVQYLWNQTSNPYSDMIDAYTSRCREFWRVLPVLRDVEHDNLD